MNILRKYHLSELQSITPWQHDQQTIKLYSYFNEFAEKKEPSFQSRKLSNLPNLYKKRNKTNLSQYHNNIKTLHKESTRKSLREVNIEFHPRINSTLNHHKFDRYESGRNDHSNVLQEISVRNFVVAGQDQTISKEKSSRKKESTYILKQKFATIRRSMILMGQGKENAFKSLRGDV